MVLLHEITVSVQADLHQPSLILELTCTDGHKHNEFQTASGENLSDVKINKCKYLDAASGWGSIYAADQQALGVCATERVIMYRLRFFPFML